MTDLIDHEATRSPEPSGYTLRQILITIGVNIALIGTLLTIYFTGIPDRKTWVDELSVYTVLTEADGSLSLQPAPYDQGYGHGESAVRFRLTIPDQIDTGRNIGQDTGLLISRVWSNAALYCGGRRIGLHGNLIDDHTPLYGQPLLYRLTEDCLTDGHVDIVVANRDSRQFKAISLSFIGPYESLFQAYQWRWFLVQDLPKMSVAVCLMVLVLIASIYTGIANKRLAQYFMGLVAAFLAYTVTLVWLINLLPSPLEMILGYSLAFALMTLGACFISVWTGGRESVRRLFLFAGSLCAICVAIALAIKGYRAIEYVAQPIQRGFLLILIGYAFRRYWIYAQSRTENSHWEFAVVIFGLLMLVIDMLLSVFVLQSYLSTMTALVLFIAVTVSIGSRNVEAYEASVTLNTVLDKKIAESEREIAHAYDQLRERDRQAAHLSERKRIMSDMHDGIGARLISMAMRARRQSVTLETLGDELYDCLEELRLIIDSLDSAGESLPLALAAFRARVQPKLDAASLDLDWKIKPVRSRKRFSASTILQIYRILQEATNNIVHHAQASRVIIALNPDRSGRVMTLSIDDDGVGMNAPGLGGKGLANMQYRAKRIGADLSLSASDLGGVRVALSFDLRDA